MRRPTRIFGPGQVGSSESKNGRSFKNNTGPSQPRLGDLCFRSTLLEPRDVAMILLSPVCAFGATVRTDSFSAAHYQQRRLSNAARSQRQATANENKKQTPPSPPSTVSHLEGILVRGNGKFVERHLKCNSPTKRNYGNPKDESYCQHLRGTNRSQLYDVLEQNFQSTPRAKRLREYRAACEIVSTSCRERGTCSA